MALDNRDFNTVQAMLAHGGSFVKKLAELAQLADTYNLQIIKDTWPEYWQRYERLGNAARGAQE